MNVPRLLSVKDAAAATTLPLSTIYDLLSQGEIRPTRIGRAVRIHEEDLLEFIERHREVAS